MRPAVRLHNREILRIIDANLNRAREGLRVCEDVARFILNDIKSTQGLKAVRHDIHRIIVEASLNYPNLYRCRNIRTDVGRGFSWLEKKKDWQAIFFANIQRTKEALRVLEEFFNLLDNKTGGKFKSLRFKVYGLEKKIIGKSKALSDSKHHLSLKDAVD